MQLNTSKRKILLGGVVQRKLGKLSKEEIQAWA